MTTNVDIPLSVYDQLRKAIRVVGDDEEISENIRIARNARGQVMTIKAYRGPERTDEQLIETITFERDDRGNVTGFKTEIST